MRPRALHLIEGLLVVLHQGDLVWGVVVEVVRSWGVPDCCGVVCRVGGGGRGLVGVVVVVSGLEQSVVG